MRFPSQAPEKTRKFRFQIEDIDIIFQRLPSQAKNNNGNPVFKEKILALFSRGSHHKPKKREIPSSNRRYWHYFPEVPITSPKKGKSRFQIEVIGIIFQRFPSQAQKKGKSRFQIEDIGIIFQKKPKKTRKSRFQMRFPSQARKNTEIPFSNRRNWYYFPEVAITSQDKQRKSRFQIEAIGIIFQRFPSQAQKKGNPVFK